MASGRSRFGLGLILLTALGVAGCNQHRGDPDGIPVHFVVTLERAWVAAISEDALVVGDGPGAADGKEARFGFGHGVWHSTTEVELRGGRHPGSGDAFVHDLGWGTTRFTVPLRPGRELALGVHVFGGRSGSQPLPSYRVPTDQDAATVEIDLTRRALERDLPPSPAE